MVKIYVLNLKSRIEKRLKIKKQLNDQNIKYEIIEGIDGKELDNNYLKNNKIEICNEYYWTIKNRNMTYGELGCTLSHLKIYEKHILENDKEYCLILEDDVIIPDNFIDKLKNITLKIDKLPNWDLIYLGRKKMNFGKDDEDCDEDNLFLKCGTSWWSCGYIINKKCCETILKSKIRQNLITIDEYLPIISGCCYEKYFKMYEIDNINCYSLKNLLIYPNKNAFIESDTENSKIIEQYSDKLTVIGVATNKNDGYYRFINSCKYYGIKYKILGLDSDVKFSFGNIEKLFFLKKEILLRNDEEIILVSDIYDVIMMKTTFNILNIFNEMNIPILFSAEKICWPDTSLKNKHPTTKSIYKYLNSGGFIGHVKYLKEIFINNSFDNINDDQLYFQQVFFKNKNITLDYECKIFQSFDKDVLYKTLNSCHFHGNGDSSIKLIFDLYTLHHYNFFNKITDNKISDNISIIIYLYNSNEHIIETIKKNIKQYKYAIVIDDNLLNNITNYDYLWIIDGNYRFDNTDVLDNLIMLNKMFSTTVMTNSETNTLSCNILGSYSNKLCIVQDIKSHILLKTQFAKQLLQNTFYIDEINKIIKKENISIFGLHNDITYTNVINKYVINCKNKEEFNKIDDDFIFYNCIDEKVIDLYNVKKDNTIYTYGELINFIAHIEVLKKNKEKEYITIFEDNIYFEDNLKDVYKNIKKIDFDILFLTTDIKNILGYIISKKGINKILNSDYKNNITSFHRFLTTFNNINLQYVNKDIIKPNKDFLLYDSKIHSKIYEKNEDVIIVKLSLDKFDNIFERNCKLLGIKYKIIKITKKVNIDIEYITDIIDKIKHDNNYIILLNCISTVILKNNFKDIDPHIILNINNKCFICKCNDVINKKILCCNENTIFNTYPNITSDSTIIEFTENYKDDMIDTFNNLNENWNKYENYKKIDNIIYFKDNIIIAIYLKVDSTIKNKILLFINNCIIFLRKKVNTGIIFYSNKVINESFKTIKDITEIDTTNIDYIWVLDDIYNFEGLKDELLYRLIQYNKEIISFLQRNIINNNVNFYNSDNESFYNDIIHNKKQGCWIVPNILGNYLIKKILFNESDVLNKCKELNIEFNILNLSIDTNILIEDNINFNNINIKRILLYDKIGKHNIYFNFFINYFNKNNIIVDVYLPSYNHIDEKLLFNKINILNDNYDIIIVINEMNDIPTFSEILLIKVYNVINIDLKYNIINTYPSIDFIDYLIPIYNISLDIKYNKIGYKYSNISDYEFNNDITTINIEEDYNILKTCKYFLIVEEQYDNNILLCIAYSYNLIPIIPKKMQNKYNLKQCIVYTNKKIVIKDITYNNIIKDNTDIFEKYLKELLFVKNNNNYIEKPVITKINDYIYQFPLFTKNFCKKLIRTVENNNKWYNIKDENSQYDERFNITENVPTYDVNLTDLGLDECFKDIIMNYVSHIVYDIFAWKTKSIHRAFIVKYEIGNQEYLKPHHDFSSYTLNILLNDDFEGGGTHFIKENITINGKIGTATLHPGGITHYHEGLRIKSGKRYVLIAFIN